jgi:hypothetical protein
MWILDKGILMVDPFPQTRDELKYKGWFWFCPIYLSDPEGEDLQVEARKEWMEFLFDVADVFEYVRIGFCKLFVKDYEPSFMFVGISKRG